MALKDRANYSMACTFGIPTNYKPTVAIVDAAYKKVSDKENAGALKEKEGFSNALFISDSTIVVPKFSQEPFEIVDFASVEGTPRKRSRYEPPPSGERTMEDEFYSAHRKVKDYYTFVNNSCKIFDERNHYYAIERAREAIVTPLSLGKKEFDFRRLVIDLTMMHTAKLKDQNLPITRATLQLAVSLLDRALLQLVSVQEIFELEDYNVISFSLLSTSVMFEKANGTYQVGCPIQRHIIRELSGESFHKNLVIFQKLQRYILDAVDFKVTAPLCVEFAHYFMLELGYDVSRIADDTQLVAYLLDCFVIHDAAINTPASKAAAAAVTLMRRIFNPDKPMNQLWNSGMIDVSGYCLRELRPVLDAMNEMLLNYADGIAGLKALHRNGWADITWKMP